MDTNKPGTTIIRDRMIKADRLAVGHQIAADRCRLLHYGLGVPVVILTTIVGTAIFASLSDGKSPLSFVASPVQIQIGTALTSVLAAVLSALQTFMNFGERAKSHAQASASFFELWRSLERLLKLEPEACELPAKVAELDNIFTRARNQAPPLSRRNETRAILKMRRELELETNHLLKQGNQGDQPRLLLTP